MFISYCFSAGILFYIFLLQCFVPIYTLTLGRAECSRVAGSVSLRFLFYTFFREAVIKSFRHLGPTPFPPPWVRDFHPTKKKKKPVQPKPFHNIIILRYYFRCNTYHKISLYLKLPKIQKWWTWD